MTETITINDSEFDLSDFRSCVSAVDEVTEHIEKLKKRKQEIEGKLSSSIFDFKNAKKLRNSKKDMEEELDHFQGLLQKLEKKSDERMAEEAVSKAEYEIARLEKQSADLSDLCLKEIPAASRKLTVIAAALKAHQKEVESSAEMAELAGVAFPDMPDPVQRIAGERAFSTLWLKNLRLPLLDEQPDVVFFWPPSNLEQYPGSHQDNPKIKDDVEDLLSAEDMLKAAKALFGKIEKRKTAIREAESAPYSIQDYSKPFWFERPRHEWADLLAPNPVMASIRQLGDKIQFWLELPEERKANAFIHLLDSAERERAIEKIPEEKRQKYLDHLMDYASNTAFEEEPEPIEATG